MESMRVSTGNPIRTALTKKRIIRRRLPGRTPRRIIRSRIRSNRKNRREMIEWAR